MMKILIDNGHGTKTPGKRSPDGRLIEGEYARKCARKVKEMLNCMGMEAILLVPEDDDIPLKERVRRANKIHRENRGGTILVSLHSDAAGNDGWSNARGFSVLVAPNASQNSKVLARCLIASAEEHGQKVRKYNGDMIPYWTKNLAICRDTNMPAVLVESFFHTNEEQVDWALSDEGFETICSIIADGIKSFV